MDARRRSTSVPRDEQERPYEARICVVESEGRGLEALTSPDESCGPPACSPIEPVIATVAIRTGDAQPFLYLLREDGSGWTRLTDIPAEGRPAWSPDGTHIAFSSGGGRLCVIGRDGSDARPVGDGPLGHHSAWTPGGSRGRAKRWPRASSIETKPGACCRPDSASAAYQRRMPEHDRCVGSRFGGVCKEFLT